MQPGARARTRGWTLSFAACRPWSSCAPSWRPAHSARRCTSPSAASATSASCRASTRTGCGASAAAASSRRSCDIGPPCSLRRV
eukprot:2296831-Prymnesium_polylepis.1